MAIEAVLAKDSFKDVDMSVKAIPGVRRHSSRINMKVSLIENKKPVTKNGNFEMFYNTFYDPRLDDIVDIIYINLDKDKTKIVIRAYSSSDDEVRKSITLKKVLDKLSD